MDKERQRTRTTGPLRVSGGSIIICRRRDGRWISTAAICAIECIGVRRGRIRVYMRVRIVAATSAAVGRRAVGGIFLR